MKLDDLTSHDILHSAKVGWEIEFIPKQSVEETRKTLQKILGKKIQYFDKAHSDFKPDDKTFKMEPDYSGGEKTLELITGPMKYIEAKLILGKAFDYIKDNANTTNRCGIHYNVSFDSKKYGEGFLSHMDVLKFILEFDEEYVYEIFPKRRSNVYAKSIKFIIPQNKYFLESDYDFNNISPKNFIMPHTKYYGVNFTKLIKGYLEFRYLGGKNYHEKYDDIIKVVDESLISLFRSVNNKEYSADNKEELKMIFNKHLKLIRAYKDLNGLFTEFPKIKFYCDMQDDPKITNLYYLNVRDRIFKILCEAQLKQGEINYDSDKGKIQIRNANLTNCHEISNVDLIECTIEGNLSNCELFHCKVDNSILDDCKLYMETDIKNSKINNCYFGKTCTANNIYVYGKKGTFNGEMKGGIFREGFVGNFAIISPETDVIEFKKI